MFKAFLMTFLLAFAALPALTIVEESATCITFDSIPFALCESVEIEGSGLYQLVYFVQRFDQDDCITVEIKKDGEVVKGALGVFNSSPENINGHSFYIYCNDRCNLDLVVTSGNCDRVNGFFFKICKLSP